jgi:hypothetical protein
MDLQMDLQMDSVIIVIFALILLFIIAIKYSNNEQYMNMFPDLPKDLGIMVRPNCPQLNSEKVCKATPGCAVTNSGCINHYGALREPLKRWEKGDDMIVF